MKKADLKKISTTGAALLVLLSTLLPTPVWATTPETTTHYFNQYYEQEITTGEDGTEELTETKHYHAGSRIAEKTNEDLIFLHQDHLASTRLVTSARGEPLATLDYYPYGAIHQYNSVALGTVGVAEAPTDRQYTSQIYDPSADLYFYNARYYNPTTASFISADTAEGPNRYAYVAGNPINANDPSGHQSHSTQWGDSGVWKEYQSSPLYSQGFSAASFREAEPGDILAAGGIMAAVALDPLFAGSALFATAKNWEGEGDAGKAVVGFTARYLSGRATAKIMAAVWNRVLGPIVAKGAKALAGRRVLTATNSPNYGQIVHETATKVADLADDQAEAVIRRAISVAKDRPGSLTVQNCWDTAKFATDVMNTTGRHFVDTSLGVHNYSVDLLSGHTIDPILTGYNGSSSGLRFFTTEGGLARFIHSVTTLSTTLNGMGD